MRPALLPPLPNSARFGDGAEISKTKQNQRFHEQPKVLISFFSFYFLLFGILILSI